MRKVSVFTVGIMVVVAVLLSAGATAESEEKPSMDVSEQIILGPLYQPTTAAVDGDYIAHARGDRQSPA